MEKAKINKKIKREAVQHVCTILPADSEVAFSDSVIAFKEEEEDVVEFFVGILAAISKKKKVGKKIN